jgi:cobalt/nickel transport system permease protein
VLIAGALSFLASGSPDGLERVAESEGFADSAREHTFGNSSLADYGEIGGIPVGIAGLLGVVATVAIGVTVFRLVRRRANHGENVTA